MTAVSVEAAVHQRSTVQALRSAADALKQVRTSDNTSLEDADNILDDLTEQVEELHLTQGALGAEFVNHEFIVDEDELMKELEALGEEETVAAAATTTKPTTTTTTTSSLPTIQTQPTSDSSVEPTSHNNDTPITTAAAAGGNPKKPLSPASLFAGAPPLDASGPPPKKKHQVLSSPHY